MKDFNELKKNIVDNNIAMEAAMDMMRETMFDIVISNTSCIMNVDSDWYNEMTIMFKTFITTTKIKVIVNDNEAEYYGFIGSTKQKYETMKSLMKFVISSNIWFEDTVADSGYIGFCCDAAVRNGNHKFIKILCAASNDEEPGEDYFE